jgi:hypothetical protein
LSRRKGPGGRAGGRAEAQAEQDRAFEGFRTQAEQLSHQPLPKIYAMLAVVVEEVREAMSYQTPEDLDRLAGQEMTIAIIHAAASLAVARLAAQTRMKGEGPCPRGN